jgi:hypothetical protein
MIIYAILLIILILFISSIKKESYSNTPMLIYQVEYNTNSLDIYMSSSNKSDSIIKFLKYRKNIKLVDKNYNTIITDPLSLLYMNDYKMISVFSDDKTCLFIKGKDDINNESLNNIIETNKPIGYLNDIDKSIITYIAIALGYRNLKLNFVKIESKLPNTINENFFKKNKIYTLFAFVSLHNGEFISKFSTDFALDFINYENFDVNIMKLFMSFSKIKNLDLSIYFKSFENRYSVKKCICFDMILAGHKKIEHNQDLNLEISHIVKDIGNIDILNFYTIYFDLFKQTREYITFKNRHITVKDQLPILEQFNNLPDIHIPNQINSYFDSTNGILTLDNKNPVYDGMPFLQGTKVYLKGQWREEENGEYIVQKEPYILKKITKTKSDDREINYECYNDTTIKTKGLCESNFDVSGKIRKPKMEWDRRCQNNEECPFYQANKNYKNYFGGCIDGYCQMPLGVSIKSYRRPDENTKPLCYNCKNPLDPFCCEEQKDRKKYPDLKSPDYAFSLDNYDRIKGMKQWYYI